jgi:hypothetical protein
MPEISITTNAGGWFRGGLMVPCPVTTCKIGTGLPQDVNDPYLLPVVYSVICELLSISTSDYIHLGSDERQESMACFHEVGMEPDFDSFEKNLAAVLSLEGISTERILRWENQEEREYPGRVGSITHCRSGRDCLSSSHHTSNPNHDDPSWFATVDLRDGGPWQIFNATRDLSLRNPIGIVANVGSIQKDYFDRNQVPKRLLAFAFGTTRSIGTDALPNRTIFEEIYTQMCEAKFGADDGCHAFARSNAGIYDYVTARRLEKHLETMCTERVFNDTSLHIFRTPVPIIRRGIT